MGHAGEKTGRSAVQELLIDPLTNIGLVRPSGVTKAAHDQQLDRLKDRLAYMSSENLEVLREVIEANPAGPQGDRWPAVITILKWAADIQAPPEDEPRLVTSWLRSIEGRKALDGGYIVELRAWLRKHRRPTNAYTLSLVREKADENMRRRMRIEEAIAAGTAREEDRAWLDAYRKAYEACLEIIAAKDEEEAA